ncbi:urea transporter [Pedobacter rhodius]|uniref:Urea transporter n=1 Tax=Pedobacter rhodius TaxID=3004098 RepID=A0ABT4KY98_9SPHI|nr:urea transporter [Pedobacter sp. SJ11]MCZ4223711.1 urea transporter [Pedobacter sp. SJ11]
MKKNIRYHLSSALNSYAILFFSQNKILGTLLFVVSMFNLNAGISGLACLICALLLVNSSGFNKENIKSGLYSFNPLLLGIGFGTFYNFNYAFWFWLAAACLLCVVLSVSLTALLGKYALPTLSIPFVITFWIVLIAANGYAGMGLIQKSSSLVFELATNVPSRFTSICNFFDKLNMPAYLALFFRSVSAVLFQNSIFAGILISLGFFIHSRIGFSLLIIGFVAACIINHLTGTYPDGISYYHLGANFMMVSCAIGGFFLIPSWRSYLWAIATIPLIFLVLNGISRLLGIHSLPVFSMPFCLVTVGLLYFFMLRKTTGKLKLTALQNYSPETNLYQFLNGEERLKGFRYLALNLPFMGSWSVSQAYNGDITHKGEWSEALDFVLKDIDNKTYEWPGIKPEDYYCYNKPVLAAAAGYVCEVIDHVDDNVIGQVNLAQNWGNTVVIKHTDNLFTKVSHLKKNSVKVKVGDYVKQGDVIALCGNSGRSPEPHLHFQVQKTPFIGSKTFAYPFAYFVNEQTNELKSFEIPKQNEVVKSPEINPYLKHAFNFQPGYITRVSNEIKQSETWEVFTDDFNYTYFFCHENGAIAYFVNNENVFYFTRFYGNRKSLLFIFYQSAYKINYSAHQANDVFANDTEHFNPGLWLQDLIAPFYTFTKNTYHNIAFTGGEGITLESVAKNRAFGKDKTLMNSKILVDVNGIRSIEILYKNKISKVKWGTGLN